MTVGEGKTWRRPASDWDYSLTEAETLGEDKDMLATRWTADREGATVGSLVRAIDPWEVESGLVDDPRHTDLSYNMLPATRLEGYDLERVMVALQRVRVEVGYRWVDGAARLVAKYIRQAGQSDLAWSEMKRIPEGWETIS